MSYNYTILLLYLYWNYVISNTRGPPQAISKGRGPPPQAIIKGRAACIIYVIFTICSVYTYEEEGEEQFEEEAATSNCTHNKQKAGGHHKQ